MPHESPTPKEQLAITVPDARAGRNGTRQMTEMTTVHAVDH
jgi:hypothetical protein